MGSDLYLNPPKEPLWKRVKNLQTRNKSLQSEVTVLRDLVRRINRVTKQEDVKPGQRLFEIEEMIRNM